MRRVVSHSHRWWLAVLQVILLMATLATPAVAAPVSPPANSELIQMLQEYQIVRGDERGNLNLNSPIKRAEMVTVIIRVMGLEGEAHLYKGMNTFTDVQGQWYEGVMNLAAIQNIVRGDLDRKARPEDPVTYGEALTLIARLIKKEPTYGTWPTNVFLAMLDLGLLPKELTAADLDTPAVRGAIFEILAKAITTVPVGEKKSVLANLDTTPPTLTVEALPENTTEAKITVSGTASGAVRVSVNGKDAAFQNGKFSISLPLTEGVNEITVVASDWAGNEAVKTFSVLRGAPVKEIAISGPTNLIPGGSATYSIEAVREDGTKVPNSALTVTVDGGIGSFDLASGRLTVADKPGAKGALTVRAGNLTRSLDLQVYGPSAEARSLRIRTVNDGRAVPYTRDMSVTVEVLDGNGNLVETDFGRTIALSVSGLPGTVVTTPTAKTVAGVAIFTVKATQPGSVSLSATSSGLTSGSATAVFGTNLRVVLTADPANLVVGGAQTLSRIKAELLDENGAPVKNNTGNPIIIRLTKEGSAGFLVDDYLTIAPGLSSASLSGDDGMFAAGSEGGFATIKGTIVSNHTFTVDSTAVSVAVPVVGPGTRLVVKPPVDAVEPGVEATYTVRLEDANGNLIQTSSYAFQLLVETSNNEPKINGIPQGVSIQLGNTGLNPVSDGIPEGASNDTTDVIARTAGGMAFIKVRYDKPGKVTLTPVLMGGWDNAYSSDGVAATAHASTGFIAVSGSGVFRSTPTSVLLRADSSGLGSNQTVASIANTASNSVTLHVTLADSLGRWVPGYAANVTLTRLDGNSTTPPTVTTIMTNDGKATFVVQGTHNPGVDRYQVTAEVGGTITSNIVEVHVVNARPSSPAIAAIRGIKDGVPRRLDYVEPDDTAMEVELYSIPNGGYVRVLVYANGSGSPLYTSDAINIGSSAPRISVPKNLLPAGSHRYEVALQNGFGVSDRSPSYSNAVMNSVYTSYIYITNAWYDAVNKVLTINGTGFAPGDTVDPSLLSVIDPSTGQSRNLNGATVTINGYSSITLNLAGLPQGTELADPALFSGGDLNIAAQGGWYRKTDGSSAAPDLTGNPVYPGARIDHAVLDRSNRRLNIYGEGFMTGTFDFSRIKLTYASAPDNQQFILSHLGATRVSDTLVTVPLTSDTVFNAVDTNTSYRIEAQEGWFVYGSARRTVTSAPIWAQVILYGVTYNNGVITISGSGFDGTLNPDLLTITDLSNPGEALQLQADKVTSWNVTPSEITITLSAAGKTWFETKFSGSDIYLQGSQGWLTKDARPSAPIGERQLRFPDFTPPSS